MVSVLQQTLRGICHEGGWCYGVFWKLKRQSRMVLTWEDAFYEQSKVQDGAKTNSNSSGVDFTPSSASVGQQIVGDTANMGDPIRLAVAKMSYHVYSVGEGIIGRVAFTNKHQWVFSTDDKPPPKDVAANNKKNMRSQHDKYPAGWEHQFAAGIQTIAVISVPQGVVQLGSVKMVSEDLKLVGHVKAMFGTLQNIPGAYLSDIVSEVQKGGLPALYPMALPAPQVPSRDLSLINVSAAKLMQTPSMPGILDTFPLKAMLPAFQVNQGHYPCDNMQMLMPSQQLHVHTHSGSSSMVLGLPPNTNQLQHALLKPQVNLSNFSSTLLASSCQTISSSLDNSLPSTNRTGLIQNFSLTADSSLETATHPQSATSSPVLGLPPNTTQLHCAIPKPQINASNLSSPLSSMVSHSQASSPSSNRSSIIHNFSHDADNSTAKASLSGIIGNLPSTPVCCAASQKGIISRLSLTTKVNETRGISNEASIPSVVTTQGMSKDADAGSRSCLYQNGELSVDLNNAGTQGGIIRNLKLGASSVRRQGIISKLSLTTKLVSNEEDSRNKSSPSVVNCQRVSWGADGVKPNSLSQNAVIALSADQKSEINRNQTTKLDQTGANSTNTSASVVNRLGVSVDADAVNSFSLYQKVVKQNATLPGDQQRAATQSGLIKNFSLSMPAQHTNTSFPQGLSNSVMSSTISGDLCRQTFHSLPQAVSDTSKSFSQPDPGSGTIPQAVHSKETGGAISKTYPHHSTTSSSNDCIGNSINTPETAHENCLVNGFQDINQADKLEDESGLATSLHISRRKNQEKCTSFLEQPHDVSWKFFGDHGPVAERLHEREGSMNSGQDTTPVVGNSQSVAQGSVHHYQQFPLIKDIQTVERFLVTSPSTLGNADLFDCIALQSSIGTNGESVSQNLNTLSSPCNIDRNDLSSKSEIINHSGSISALCEDLFECKDFVKQSLQDANTGLDVEIETYFHHAFSTDLEDFDAFFSSLSKDKEVISGLNSCQTPVDSPKDFGVGFNTQNDGLSNFELDSALCKYIFTNPQHDMQTESCTNTNNIQEEPALSLKKRTTAHDTVILPPKKIRKCVRHIDDLPKHREKIQDSLQELRHLIPDCGKCNIDVLLQNTVRYINYLQEGPTNIKTQTQASKMLNNDACNGSDSIESSWAMKLQELKGDCPIIVENLNGSKKLLVEMRCERPSFLSNIFETLKQLGLTVLNTSIETRNGDVWAQFFVERVEEVHRLQILWSLMQLLESI